MSIESTTLGLFIREHALVEKMVMIILIKEILSILIAARVLMTMTNKCNHH
jgi:hypothetical protein